MFPASTRGTPWPASLAHPDGIAIGAVVEQVPDPASRISLSDEVDGLRTNRAKIDWRVSDREFQTARRMAEILKQEMLRLGFSLPDFADWLKDDDILGIRSDLHDMAHSMGSTRMAARPSEGVVDANCKVHGVTGLYVAGGSVFSTSGYMNPTFMIVALSLRLADHLKSVLTLGSQPIHSRSEPVVRVSVAPRARVGFVGAGHRVRTVYQPILSSLEDKFELAGFVARSSDTRTSFAAASGLAGFESAECPDLRQET